MRTIRKVAADPTVNPSASASTSRRSQAVTVTTSDTTGPMSHPSAIHANASRVCRAPEDAAQREEHDHRGDDRRDLDRRGVAIGMESGPGEERVHSSAAQIRSMAMVAAMKIQVKSAPLKRFAAGRPSSRSSRLNAGRAPHRDRRQGGRP